MRGRTSSPRGAGSGTAGAGRCKRHFIVLLVDILLDKTGRVLAMQIVLMVTAGCVDLEIAE